VGFWRGFRQPARYAVLVSGGIPVLALVFALLLVAFTVYDVDRRAGVDGYLRVVVRGCQVATGVTMAFTLIIMI